MKTKITILLLMIAFAFTASAQSIGDFIDVVHLKNGTVVKGIIMEQVPGQSVRIQATDGKSYSYSIYDVAKFTREAKTNASESTTTTSTTKATGEKTCTKSKEACASKSSCKDKAACAASGKTCCSKFKVKSKGYFAEIDLMANTVSRGLRVTQGYKFGRFGYVGVGLGVEGVDLRNSYFAIPEITLNLMYAGDILNKRITPFYQIEAGYGFSLDRYGYNKGKFDIGGPFGAHKFDKDDDKFDNDFDSTLNYGGPQGGVVVGVKFFTKKKVYFKAALEAKITSNFSDNHYSSVDDLGVETSEIKKIFKANSGIGARIGIGF